MELPCVDHTHGDGYGDRENTLASLQRIADLLAESKAELWIHHDTAQAGRQRRAPAFYD